MMSKVELEKDPKASSNKKEKYKSLAQKAKKVSSDEESSSSDNEDKEYAMTVKDFNKFFRRREKFARQPHDDKKAFRRAKEHKRGKVDRKCFKCGDLNHFISDCPKHSYNDQKAFVEGAWSVSDEDEDLKKDEICLKKDEICLMAHETFQNEYNKLCKIRFTKHKASTSKVKMGKTSKNAAKNVTEDPAHLYLSERDLASVSKGIRTTLAVGNTKQPSALKLGQGLVKSKIKTRPKTPRRRPNTVFPKSNYNQVN
ncbi:zf-CCHC domain-containing protein [Tanacetum coccineum]